VPGEDSGGSVDRDIDGANVRDLLDEQRSSTLARIQAMTSDHDAIVGTLADANIDDEHDPEGSTIAFERAQVAALLIEARAYLDELDQALARLEAGSYAICERCGGPIGTDRLAARPAARTCISCAPPRPGRGVGEAQPRRVPQAGGPAVS
jgi:RNA polymerase-binding transcription factor DksA